MFPNETLHTNVIYIRILKLDLITSSYPFQAIFLYHTVFFNADQNKIMFSNVLSSFFSILIKETHYTRVFFIKHIKYT